MNPRSAVASVGLCLLAALSALDCAHSRLPPPPRVKPAWIPRPNRSHPDVVFVTGSCRGIRRRELARRCAIADAKLQIRRALERETLRFKSSYIEDEHFEHRGSPEAKDPRFDWWVLVAYPRSAEPASASSPPAETAPAVTAEEQRLLARWRALDQRSREALLTLLDRLATAPSSEPATASRQAKQTPVLIFVHHGVGTSRAARVWGQVIGAGSAGAAGAASAGRAPEGLPRIVVRLEVQGRQYSVQPDDEGAFSLDLPGPLPVGTHAVKARTDYPLVAHIHDGHVTVYPDGDGRVVVSSVKNTVVRSSRLCKLILAMSPQSALMARPRHLKRCTRAYPGAVENVRAWSSAHGPVIFLSPLPPVAFPLFTRVLQVHGFPPSPQLFAGRSLRKLSSEARAQSQVAKLNELLALLPGYQFTLVGNDVGSDIAAYARVAQDRAGRIAGTHIHHVPYRKDHQETRPGQRRFANHAEIRELP